MSSVRWKTWVALFIMAFVAHPAVAHEGNVVRGRFLEGFAHPFFGLDHMLAMIAVGIWGGILGRPLVYALPTLFPVVMAIGGVLAMAGIIIPFTEIGIALSLITLGALIAAERRLPLFAALIIVAVFAVCHGFAHGTELPLAADPIAYSAGFVSATGLLHMVGIVVGWLGERSGARARVSLGSGLLIVMAGGYFLLVQGMA
jgi:urease accessory protein